MSSIKRALIYTKGYYKRLRKDRRIPKDNLHHFWELDEDLMNRKYVRLATILRHTYWDMSYDGIEMILHKLKNLCKELKYANLRRKVKIALKYGIQKLNKTT